MTTANDLSASGSVCGTQQDRDAMLAQPVGVLNNADPHGNWLCSMLQVNHMQQCWTHWKR
jgi:hypothetical protein